MFKVSSTVVIARPVSEVFEYVSDPHNMHNWQPGLHEVKAEGNKHSEVRKMMGHRIKHDFETVDRVVNEKISHKGSGNGHEGEMTRHITFGDKGGSTSVTLEMDVDTKGVLKAGEPVMQRMIQREVKSDLEHLKDILEAHGDLKFGIESRFAKHA